MKEQKTSVILLAGGMGTRMGAATPKQYLVLKDKPLVRYSFEVFLTLPEIDEIVVVCDPQFKKLFHSTSSKPVVFALPGHRRQDSVFNGLQAASHALICIHDGARPFISKELVLKVLEQGRKYGAATLGVPVKFTVKESDPNHFVTHTPDRNKLWEIQTPQVLDRELLNQGFTYAHQHEITVTDDVSLAELLNKSVKLVEGSPTNLKITVPADLVIANQLIEIL
jgi:2-C-methyl-D-erythritol 4-phosphate cytidylyltransferase